MAERGAVHRIALAAGREAAAEDHLVDRFVRGNGDAALITPTVTAAQRELVFDPQVLEWRIHPDPDRIAIVIGLEPVTHDLEVHQQGIRRNVVGPQGLAIELARVVVRHLEVAVVDEQVAVDLVDAGLAHQSQHLPDALCNQERVAPAANEQVSVEAAVAKFAEREDIGGPCVSRAQHIEADEGRQELHRRCRIARHIVLPSQDDLAAVHVLHENTQRVVRDLANIENMANRLRQFRLLCHRDRYQSAGEQQAEEWPVLHS